MSPLLDLKKVTGVASSGSKESDDHHTSSLPRMQVPERKCIPVCIFAPHFVSDQGVARFTTIHKVFGINTVSKLLLHVPPTTAMMQLSPSPMMLRPSSPTQFLVTCQQSSHCSNKLKPCSPTWSSPSSGFELLLLLDLKKVLTSRRWQLWL